MPRKKRQTTTEPIVQLSADDRREMGELRELAEVISRTRLFMSLGKSFQNRRDIYVALGYPKELTFEMFWNKYVRQDIAKRAVNAYPDATWRGRPDVSDDQDPKVETEFEKAWNQVVDDNRVWHYFTRADRLCGVGKYSVLYMGFDDLKKGGEKKPSDPVEKASKLLYLQPYSETNAEIYSIVSDVEDSRFGLPETYSLKVQTSVKTKKGIRSGAGETRIRPGGKTVVVHWSRCIHIAEGLVESNVFGTPRLECIYNRLDNLELILGGSSEAFWKTGFPGIAFEQEAGAKMSDEARASLNEQIEKFQHSLERFLKLKGIKANQLRSDVADPDKHFDILIKIISGATGIPSRILLGSERGELASTQDRENWDNRIEERQLDFAEPVILREFVDRLILFGILPKPKEGKYTVTWPSDETISESEKAEIAERRTKAIAAYVQSGAQVLIPPRMFLTTILGMTDEEADAAEEEINRMIDEEERQEAEDVKAMEREGESEEEEPEE